MPAMLKLRNRAGCLLASIKAGPRGAAIIFEFGLRDRGIGGLTLDLREDDLQSLVKGAG